MANDFIYPSNVGTGFLSSAIKFSEWERQDRNASVPANSFTFYMPEKLANPNTVSWDAEKLGLIAGTASGALSGGSSFSKESYDAASGAISRIPYNVASSLAARLGSGASADTLMGAISNEIPNPYLTLLFRGVDFRTFEFIFKFYPRAAPDINNIHAIITALRAASLPPGDSETIRPTLGYPNEFTIEYLFDGRRNIYLNKFKRCVIVGLNIDYTGSGMWAMTRDGFPAEITMNIRFTEIDIVLRKDVTDFGY